MNYCRQKVENIAAKLQLPHSFIDEFTDMAEVIIVKKGDFLVEEGTICQYIGITETGALYSYINDDEKHFVNDLFLPKSTITYYRSFLSQLPASGSIQAITDSTIYAFSYDRYKELIISKNWLAFFKYIADSLFIRKCARENSFIKFSAAERYRQLIKLHPNVEQVFTQNKIASYLGIQPETLSRIKSLELKNLISGNK